METAFIAAINTYPTQQPPDFNQARCLIVNVYTYFVCISIFAICSHDIYTE